MPDRGPKFGGKNSIRRMLLLALLAVLLPALLLVGFIMFTWLRAGYDMQQQSSLNLARGVSKAFENYVSDVRRQILIIGEAIRELPDAQPEQISRLLTYATLERGTVNSLNWATPEARIIASSLPGSVGLDIADREYFRDVMARGGRDLGDLITSRATGLPAITIAQRLDDPAGKPVGVAVATIDLAKLGTKLVGHMGSDESILLADSDGSVVLHVPTLALTPEQRSAVRDMPAFREAQARREGFTSYVSPFDGQQRLIVFVPVANTGWVAAASIPRQSVLAPLWRTGITIGAIALLVLVLAGLAAGIINQRIVRDVRLVQQRAAVLANETAPPAAPPRIAELRLVAEAYEQMAERRLQAEVSLRDQQQRLALATAAADQGTWDMNVQTHEMIWSERGKTIFDLPPAASVDYALFLSRVHPDDRARIEQSVQRALDPAQSDDYHVECRVLTGTGQDRWVDVRGRAIFETIAGRRQAVRFLGTVMDVTARREAEESLRRTAMDLARSNKELEQFAYVASHDLQEPLRMIGGYLQLIQRRYQGKLDKDADQFIDYAVGGAQRMKDLINDLLSFSRLGARTRALGPVEMDAALRQAQANLGAALEAAQGRVEVPPLPVVFGDEPQLVQLLQNLISNAVKFRGEKSPLVQVGARPDGPRWLFWVRDNGIGIEPQYHERIFAIFQRLHSQQTYPGTGIGLAICRKIVERHGGRLWVESRPGEGSTFFFTLARAPGRTG